MRATVVPLVCYSSLLPRFSMIPPSPQSAIPVLDAGTSVTAARSDSALLVAVGQQDKEAFQVLYERYSGRLLAYAHAMGRGRLSAEDLVQEIFVGIWRKAGQYRAELGTPEAWIFTITRNKVCDIWRTRSFVEDSGDMDLETLMDTTERLDPTLVVTIRKALMGLPTDQRRPLRCLCRSGSRP